MKKFSFKHIAFFSLALMAGQATATPGQDNARIINGLAQSLASTTDLTAMNGVISTASRQVTTRPVATKTIATLNHEQNQDIHAVAAALEQFNIIINIKFSAPASEQNYEQVMQAGIPSALNQLAQKLRSDYLTIYSDTPTSLAGNSGYQVLIAQAQTLSTHASRIQGYGQAQRQARLDEEARIEAVRVQAQQVAHEGAIHNAITNTNVDYIVKPLVDYVASLSTTPAALTQENTTAAYKAVAQNLVDAFKSPDYATAQSAKIRATINKAINTASNALIAAIPADSAERNIVIALIYTQQAELISLFETIKQIKEDDRATTTLEALEAIQQANIADIQKPASFWRKAWNVAKWTGAYAGIGAATIALKFALQRYGLAA